MNFSAITSKQRIAAAMQHRPVDRVPVMCQLSIGHYLLNTDVSPVELWFTSEGFARALLLLQRRYRFDGILINLLGTDPDWKRFVARIETSPDGSQRVFFKNGDLAWCPADDNVQYFPAGGRHYPTLAEIDPELIYYDDPHSLGGLKYPYYFGLEPYRADPADYWPPYIFRTIDMVVAEVGSTVSIHGEIFSPWTQFMELLGYQECRWLPYMMTRPRYMPFWSGTLRGAADLGIRQAKRECGCGADFLRFCRRRFYLPKALRRICASV